MHFIHKALIRVEADTVKAAKELVENSNHNFCLGDAPLEYGDNPVQIELTPTATWRAARGSKNIR